VTAEIAARLAALGIELAAEAEAYSVFARGNCLALVHRTETGFASLGSSGMMTEAGLAYLVWREDRPLLVGKGIELAAGTGEVDRIRQFSGDLKAALGLE
jgi:hypothetical protein